MRQNYSIVLVLAFAANILLADSVRSQSRTSTTSGLRESFVSITENVAPTVVSIIATGYGPTYQQNPDLFSKRQSGGSGVIVDTAGYIITNAHVVAGAKRIQVILPVEADLGQPGKSILKGEGELIGAQLVGLDVETDLAVLRVQHPTPTRIEFADSDDLRPGELVLAFGSPLGLRNSVTMGVVSAVARQLTEEDPMIYIQTDAPINPGNSGGPLVNMDGRLIGINTLIFSQSGGSEGIGFAAPSNIVENVYLQLREYGYVRRGEIGVHAQTITPTLAEAMNLPQNWGVILGDVIPGSPAAKVGLKVGDIVLSMDGKAMENGRQFDVNLYRRVIGQKVSLEVWSSGATLVIGVPVVERPDDPDRFASMASSEHNLIPGLAILGVEIDGQIRRMIDRMRKPDGVIVAALMAGGLRGQNSLRTGDIIYTVNGIEIGTLSALRTAVESASSGSTVVLQVERSGGLRYLTLQIQ